MRYLCSSLVACLSLVTQSAIAQPAPAPDPAPPPASEAPPSASEALPPASEALPPVLSPQPASPPPTSPVVAARPAAPAPLPPPPEPAAGVHTHDGFYFRLATGFGVMSEALRSEDSDVYEGEVKGHTTGFATVSEIAFGGTIARGFVLGGGAYTAQLVSATFRTRKDSAGDPPAELDPEQRNFTLVGPFADWYFNEHRGLHAQAALGLATFSAVGVGTVSSDDPYHAAGVGLMLGIGYEWWIGDEWSMGAMARMTGAVLVGEDDSDVRWYHGLGTSPSPMLTITYH